MTERFCFFLETFFLWRMLCSCYLVRARSLVLSFSALFFWQNPWHQDRFRLGVCLRVPVVDVEECAFVGCEITSPFLVPLVLYELLCALQKLGASI